MLPITESVNPLSENLDQLNSSDLVQLFVDDHQQILKAIADVKEDIGMVIEVVSESLRQGGSLIYVGAGTSGRLGVLDAVECPPTFSTEPDLVKAIIAGGERAIQYAVEGAEDDEAAGYADVLAKMNLKSSENAEIGVREQPLDGTVAERASSRLRRTSDRSGVISGDAEDASHVSGSYPSKQKYKLDSSSLHEDNEDDENAEIGVREQSLDGTVTERASSRLRRTNDRSVLQVHEDNEDDENAEIGVREQCHDVVIGISASGGAAYVIGALKAAREYGAKTAVLTNNHGAEIIKYADYSIFLDTGPEILSGSTRLKAGTSQKMVLNIISTSVMVKLGKTFGNLMIDVKVSNKKLKERAIRLVSLIADCDKPLAEQALALSNNRVKQAVLYLKKGLDFESATDLLKINQNYLSRALA
jgi:N-acetylmuramic acid 6-phosphate (MurNAc-6-P) etherase